MLWKKLHGRRILHFLLVIANHMQASSPLHGRSIEALNSAPELPKERPGVIGRVLEVV
jgi:hypothetical protein